MNPIKIGIVGAGAIAKREHIPTLKVSRDYRVVGCADTNADKAHYEKVEGVDYYCDLADMLKACPDLDAIAICTPPRLHYDDALQALKHGKHVLLEKPPCDTTEQLLELEALAAKAKRTLFTAWHSQYAPGVSMAKDWLSTKNLLSASIVWKEELEKWHKGQEWIKRNGGYGVFDPGINAISIMTKILPSQIHLIDSDLHVPPGWEAPDLARLRFKAEGGGEITAVFEFHQSGGEDIWNMEVRTKEGVLTLAKGGELLVIDGVCPPLSAEKEYPALYRHFARLIRNEASDVDAQPLSLVEDAFRIAAAGH